MTCSDFHYIPNKDKHIYMANLPHERPWFGTTGSFLKVCITWGTPHLEHHQESLYIYCKIEDLEIK